jgi:membrane protein YdbS with pleckstrin-like domain
MTTSFDKNILPEFDSIKDDDEIIQWTGKPVFVPYLLTNIWTMAFLLLFFGGNLIWLILDPTYGTKNDGSPHYALWGVSIVSTGYSLLFIINSVLSFGNTAYAYSTKRIMIRTGFIGTDFKTIDYDKIVQSEVNVNMIERVYNVGSVRFSAGDKDSKGNFVYDRFISIENPYEIFKLIKKTTVDIKTDFNYPNAMRPSENPGYNTQYKPKN